MTRAEYINHFIAKSKDPKFEFSSVRKELEAQKVDPEEIKIIVRSVDNVVQYEAIKETNNLKGKEVIYSGAALLTFGLFMTVGNYTGFIDFGNVYVIAWGPVLAGGGMIFAGLSQQQN
ncbi:MAG: hypothetical protein JKX84_09405 [Flavobacteriales bacterium]|nr:hypothetical protein [Flavobacteriales bacterium]